MKKYHILPLIMAALIVLLAGLGVASSGVDSSPVDVNAGCGRVPIASPSGLGSGPVVFQAAIPAALALDPYSIDEDDAKRMVDNFAWETFLALNWPASFVCRGTPADHTLRDASPTDWTTARVWETYKAPYELFQVSDSDWNPANISFDDPAPTGACGSLAGSNGGPQKRLLYESVQAGFATKGALVDQQENIVWYEILINRDSFDYIRDNGWAATGAYSYKGPLAGISSVDFPTSQNGATGAGSMEIKASWREMTDDDDQSRYFTREAITYDGSSCTSVTVGLVGMHIIRKIDNAPRWIWMTFEHEDNVPKVGTTGDGRDYNFWSLSCAEQAPSDCWAQVAITDEAYYCCPNLLTSPEYNINQVTRLIPIQANTELNDKYREAFAGMNSPFQYFVLVGAQWAKPQGATPQAWKRPCNPNGPWSVQPPDPGEPCYEQIPEFLRNTSMETYTVQTDGTGTQNTTDSCMNCHIAGAVDGSFLWQDAMDNQYEVSD